MPQLLRHVSAAAGDRVRLPSATAVKLQSRRTRAASRGPRYIGAPPPGLWETRPAPVGLRRVPFRKVQVVLVDETQLSRRSQRDPTPVRSRTRPEQHLPYYWRHEDRRAVDPSDPRSNT